MFLFGQCYSFFAAPIFRAGLILSLAASLSTLGVEPERLFDTFMELACELMDNRLESGTFEESVLKLFTIRAHKVSDALCFAAAKKLISSSPSPSDFNLLSFIDGQQVYTIDKLAQTIVRQMQLLVDETSRDLVGAYLRKLREPQLNYRQHVMELVEDSKVLYKISQQPNTTGHVIHVQMIDLTEPEQDMKLQTPTVSVFLWKGKKGSMIHDWEYSHRQLPFSLCHL